MNRHSGWESDRTGTAFGDVTYISGRALQRFSFAAMQGADNLLSKARRALDGGDPDRAAQLVERSARLPYDDHERAWPAVLAAHMELFGAVTDALEDADETDSRWLDAALAAFAGLDERGTRDLRDVLRAIDADYSISVSEHRRLAAAIAPVPDGIAMDDPQRTASELTGYVSSVLHARRVYADSLAALRSLPSNGARSSS